MDQRRTTGAQGEQIAVAHLEGLGWTVVDRNWRSGRLGELDVVALQPGPGRLGTLVFCEVKTRRGLGYGDPLEAITTRSWAVSKPWQGSGWPPMSCGATGYGSTRSASC